MGFLPVAAQMIKGGQCGAFAGKGGSRICTRKPALNVWLGGNLDKNPDDVNRRYRALQIAGSNTGLEPLLEKGEVIAVADPAAEGAGPPVMLFQDAPVGRTSHGIAGSRGRYRPFISGGRLWCE